MEEEKIFESFIDLLLIEKERFVLEESEYKRRKRNILDRLYQAGILIIE